MSPDDRVELYMGDDTEPVDALEFVLARTADPVRFRDGDVVVFNYHNQRLDPAALAEWAGGADPGVYVVPYQVPGVWTFMHAALPSRVRHGDLLAYRKSSQTYVDYANWHRTLSLPGESFSEIEAVRELLDAVLDAAMEVDHDV